MRKAQDSKILLLLAVPFTIAAYFVFRLLLSGKAPEYATEIAAAVFGGLLTAGVTMILLNEQTKVEMRKEHSTAILNAKLEVYNDLMGEVQGLLSKDSVEPGDVVTVQMLNQKLAAIGGIHVVGGFQAFNTKFAEVTRDKKLSDDDKNQLLATVANMSVAMRLDLLSPDELRGFDRKAFEATIESNVKTLPTPKTTPDGFLDLCNEDEREYFSTLLSRLDECAMRYDMGIKGFSVWSGEGKSVLQCYPTQTKRRNQFVVEGLSGSVRQEIEQALKARLPGERFDKKNVAFSCAELGVEDLCGLLTLIQERTKPPAV